MACCAKDALLHTSLTGFQPISPAEAPALEEALRAAGFGRDEVNVFHNPEFTLAYNKSSSSTSRTKPGVVPASAALRIAVRPKRSSIAVVADAGKQAKQSIFQSAANTATLTAGMVSHAHLPCLLRALHRLDTSIARVLLSAAFHCVPYIAGNKQASQSHDYFCNANDPA